jgi:hypothetical protein
MRRLISVLSVTYYPSLLLPQRKAKRQTTNAKQQCNKASDETTIGFSLVHRLPFACLLVAFHRLIAALSAFLFLFYYSASIFIIMCEFCLDPSATTSHTFDPNFAGFFSATAIEQAVQQFQMQRQQLSTDDDDGT